MKKITTLLLLFVMTFSQAQLFSSIRTNGGVDDGSSYVTGVNFYTFNGSAMSSWDTY